MLLKNYILNIFYHIITIIAPLITSPYLSRVLGKEGLGSYQYTYTIAGYFAMVCLMGIGTYGLRECAMVKDDTEKRSKLFWEIYCVQLGFSCVSLLFYGMYIFLFGDGMVCLLLIQGCFVLSYAMDITWLFYGMEEFSAVIIRNIFIKMCSVLAIFMFVQNSEDVTVYCMIMAGSALLSQLVMWPFVHRHIICTSICFEEIKKHFKPITILFLPLIGMQIYSSVDKLMIGNMLGMDAVGIYGTAEGIAKMPWGTITAFSAIMMPRVSAVIGKNNQSMINNYRKLTMQVTMMLAFPVCFGLSAVSKKMIPWYLAEEFAYCSTVLRYVVVILIFLAWTDVIQNQYIIPLKRDSVLVIGAFLTAGINIAMNYLCIPKWGIMGAVYGTVISEAFVMTFLTFAVRDEIDLKDHLKSICPFFFFAVIMYLCVIKTGNLVSQCSIWLTMLQVGVGIVVYGLLCMGWFLYKSLDFY